MNGRAACTAVSSAPTPSATSASSSSAVSSSGSLPVKALGLKCSRSTLPSRRPSSAIASVAAGAVGHVGDHPLGRAAGLDHLGAQCLEHLGVDADQPHGVPLAREQAGQGPAHPGSGTHDDDASIAHGLTIENAASALVVAAAGERLGVPDRPVAPVARTAANSGADQDRQPRGAGRRVVGRVAPVTGDLEAVATPGSRASGHRRRGRRSAGPRAAVRSSRLPRAEPSG